MVNRAGKFISLLVISPGGLGQHYHGPAISLYRILSTLKNRVTVDVLHRLPEHGDVAPMEGRAIRAGTVRGHFRSFISYPLLASWFILKNRKRYDVVMLAASNFLTLVPGAIAHLCGMRVIVRVAAIAEVSSQTGGTFGNALKRRLMRQASAYLAISKGIMEDLGKAIGEDASIHYIPNSVDTERFNLGKRQTETAIAGEPSSESALGLELVCVGAVGERKGQHLLIEALSYLPDNVSLRLVGPLSDPYYLKRIEAMIDDSSLEGRVVHIPFMSDIERAYGAGDIFLLPSTGEGMPNGMLEAMACGLVPIGTRISGIEDLIQDDCGRFVERDAHSIATAVLPYVEDPELLERQGKRARQVIENSYASHCISGRLFALLSDTPVPE